MTQPPDEEPTTPPPTTLPPTAPWGSPGGPSSSRSNQFRSNQGGSSQGPATQQEQRQWAMLAHLGGVLALWPVIPLIPALVILSVYSGRDEFIKDQAREALNFQTR